MKEGVCKYYVPNIRNEKHWECEAQVNIIDLMDGDTFGIFKRMPCFAKNNAQSLCDKYCEPTAEELKTYYKEIEEVSRKFIKALPLIDMIKDKYKNHSAAGIEDCPACDGQIKWFLSGKNNHIRMHCDTDNCINFVE